MKRAIVVIITLVFASLLCSCSSNTSEVDELKQEIEALQTQVEEQKQQIEDLEGKPSSTPASSVRSSSSSTASSSPSRTSSSSTSTSSFTNKYGTRTTKCAHPGCNNYIASSGDTNCCTTHSNRCLECHKYIDEDALYCIDCLTSALSQH